MSAILYPTFVDAALNKDIEKLVSLSRSLIADTPLSDPKKVLGCFGIDLIYSSIPYEASIVVNDSLANLQVSLIINTRERSDTEELFLIYHMLGHFLLDVQTRLLNETSDTFAMVETGSPLIDRFYKNIKETDEYSKDLFASSFLLPSSKLEELQTLSKEEIVRITGLDNQFIEFRLNILSSFTTTDSFKTYSITGSNLSSNDQEIIKQGFTKSVATSSYKQAKNTLGSKEENQKEEKNNKKNNLTLENKGQYTLDPSTSVGLKMLRDLAGKISVTKDKKGREKRSKNFR